MITTKKKEQEMISILNFLGDPIFDTVKVGLPLDYSPSCHRPALISEYIEDVEYTEITE